MSSPVLKSKDELAHGDVDHAEVLHNPDLMSDAFDAERREHEQGAWAAAKAHPWACFWAFMMCFTIVSRHTKATLHQRLTFGCRSWNLSICS
jgi:SP family general alpha glucoside:H+ symporter-like MFS transporter